MRVIEHDPDRLPQPEPEPEPAAPPPRAPVVYKAFRSVPIGHSRELRIELSESSTGRAVSLCTWASKGHGRPLVPGRATHVFASEVSALLDALTEAAAAIGAEIPTAFGHHVDTSGAVPSTTTHRRGITGPENTHA